MKLLPAAMNAIGCENVYDARLCHFDPEEDNFEKYATYDSTRAAIHVGSM